MDKTKKQILFISIFSLIMLLAYFFKFTENETINSFFTFTIPLVPIYFGILAIKYFGKTTQGKIVSLMTLTFTLWYIGDILWYIFFGEATTSLADVFYLSAYLFFFMGIILTILLVNESFFKKNWLLVLIGTVISFIIYNYFFPVTWDNSTSIVENIVISGYVIMDFILLSGILLLISSVFSGNFATPWIHMGIGAILTWIGDIYYALNSETYVGGQLIDIVWNLSYMFFAIGMVLIVHKAKITMDSVIANVQMQKKEKKKK